MGGSGSAANHKAAENSEDNRAQEVRETAKWLAYPRDRMDRDYLDDRLACRGFAKSSENSAYQKSTRESGRLGAWKFCSNRISS